MDKLERESAHFSGPGPLLMASTQTKDLLQLLSGAAPRFGKVGEVFTMI